MFALSRYGDDDGPRSFGPIVLSFLFTVFCAPTVSLVTVEQISSKLAACCTIGTTSIIEANDSSDVGFQIKFKDGYRVLVQKENARTCYFPFQAKLRTNENSCKIY